MKNPATIVCWLFVLGLSSLAAGGADVELPMRFRGTMPAVEVTVNGQGPFLFAIDTGGQGQARADTSLVDELGLKATGQVEAGDGSGENNLQLDLVRLDSLRIGDLEFTDVEAITRDYNRHPALEKIDGILGFGLFKDHLLTLDYPGQRVILSSGELPEANGRDILDYHSANGLAQIEIQVAGRTVKAFIDSGNMVGPFVLPAELVESLPQEGEARVVGQARTVANTVEIHEARLRDSIRIGEFEFPQPRVTYPALKHANIGSRLLREFSITFDQKNKRLRLVRTEVPEPQPEPEVGGGRFAEYVGQYEIRRIFERDAALWLQRDGGPELKLEPLEKDLYALARVPSARIEFVRDAEGRIAAMKVLNPAGEWETSAKQQ